VWPAGNRDPRLRIPPGQVIEQPGGENRVTNAVRRDKQDPHSAAPYPKRARFGTISCGSPSAAYAKAYARAPHQAVPQWPQPGGRIPREFELPGREATIRKEDAKLVIEPLPPTSLLEVLKTLSPLEEEFPQIADLPNDPVKL
jgi:antitoxin VapB